MDTTPIIRAAHRSEAQEPFRFAIPVPDPTVDGGERHEQFAAEMPLDSVALMALAEAEAMFDPRSMAYLAAVGQFLSAVVGEQDYPRLRQAMRRARFDHQDIINTAGAIIVGGTGRPTGPASGSVSSQGPSGESSSDASDGTGAVAPPPFQPTS